jgi:hypothetical protein
MAESSREYWQTRQILSYHRKTGTAGIFIDSTAGVRCATREPPSSDHISRHSTVGKPMHAKLFGLSMRGETEFPNSAMVDHLSIHRVTARGADIRR